MNEMVMRFIEINIQKLLQIQCGVLCFFLIIALVKCTWSINESSRKIKQTEKEMKFLLKHRTSDFRNYVIDYLNFQIDQTELDELEKGNIPMKYFLRFRKNAGTNVVFENNNYKNKNSICIYVIFIITNILSVCLFSILFFSLLKSIVEILCNRDLLFFYIYSFLIFFFLYFLSSYHIQKYQSAKKLELLKLNKKEGEKNDKSNK